MDVARDGVNLGADVTDAAFTISSLSPRGGRFDEGIVRDGDRFVKGSELDCVVGGEILGIEVTSVFIACATANAYRVLALFAVIGAVTGPAMMQKKFRRT